MDKTTDVIAAMDKRASSRITDYDQRHGMLTGYVTGVEIGAASVQLEGSGRYLKSVPTLQDMELEVGDLVLLVRAGRSGWLIVGAVSWSQACADVYPGGDDAGALARFDGFTTWSVHFENGALPAGYAWAGAPFTTPGTVSIDTSRVKWTQTAAVADRNFLYKPLVPTSTMRAKVCFTTLVVNGYMGIRWDDGTDNNYVECTLNMSVGTPTALDFKVYYRVGGGAVNSVLGSTIYHPDAWTLVLTPTGTKWSNWGVSYTIIGATDLGGGATIWATSSNPSGLTWTPARVGVVSSKPNTATWYSYKVDAIYVA